MKKPLSAPHKFRLYIVQNSVNSTTAIKNLKSILSEKLGDAFILETIDVYAASSEAEADKIITVPTLIRLHPKPIKRLIGDLSDKDLVCLLLGL